MVIELSCATPSLPTRLALAKTTAAPKELTTKTLPRHAEKSREILTSYWAEVSEPGVLAATTSAVSVGRGHRCEFSALMV